MLLVTDSGDQPALDTAAHRPSRAIHSELVKDYNVQYVSHVYVLEGSSEA